MFVIEPFIMSHFPNCYDIQNISVQVESSDFYVNWKSFVDIEELGVGKHHTGISHYEVIIGRYRILNYIFYPQNWQQSQFNGTVNWTIFHFLFRVDGGRK